MAKRLTDTEKWKKCWFRQLKPVYKCFWQYICDNCNHAGIWDVDFDLAEVFIGEKLDQKEIKQIFKKQYWELHKGFKWLIIDFIRFQYGELNTSNTMYVAVRNALRQEGVSLEDIWRIHPGKDKRKRKVIRKVKDKDPFANPECLICDGTGLIEDDEGKTTQCSCKG